MALAFNDPDLGGFRANTVQTEIVFVGRFPSERERFHESLAKANDRLNGKIVPPRYTQSETGNDPFQTVLWDAYPS